MRLTRREAIVSGLAAATFGPTAWAQTQNLQTLKFGVGLKILNATFMNVMIGERLGFMREQGYHLEGLALGSLSGVFIGLDKSDIQFGVISPSIALPLYAKGQLPPITAFYEYTYPYKWDVVVKPGSPIKSYAGLKGKKIGVSNLGATDYPVTREVLKNIHVDPDTDVSWVVVGEGVSAGVALERGVIDALAYFDTGFGAIEAAGMQLRYLPRPHRIPFIGGFFIGARRDYIEKNRATCVAFGRSIAMSTEYILTNPAAGARAFLAMFPGTAPRGITPEAAVQRTLKVVKRRLTLYRPPYKGAKLGSIQNSEWRAEANFIGLKLADLKPLFTNALIDEINDFDRAKVIALAKAAKS
ncbi:MAG: ABC transporter substrate-binding protein [Alphaproteobacteria bacterium]|nr:ABC transporter substrate-binding protein [Alphaproteobacteria bacterium]